MSIYKKNRSVFTERFLLGRHFYSTSWKKRWKIVATCARVA